MKPHWKQVNSEFDLYLLYDIMWNNVYMIKIMSALRQKIEAVLLGGFLCVCVFFFFFGGGGATALVFY